MDMKAAAPLVLAGSTAAAASLCVLATSSWAEEARRRSRGRRVVSVGRYPVVGSMRHLREPLYLDLYERFGHEPIVSVHYGLQEVFVFNQWWAFKEAMLDNAEKLAGRISQEATFRIIGDYGGIVNSDGEVWHEYRRFTLKTLRDLGFGRKAGEELIVAEAEHLCRDIDAADGAPIQTSMLMSTATSNIICQLVFGYRVASEDPRFAEILELFQSFSQNEDSSAINAVLLSLLRVADSAPFVLDFLQVTPSVKKLVGDFMRLLSYCAEHRDKHAAEMASVDQARDYIEAHLQHQQADARVFNNTRLAMAVVDLFLAGTDTTSHTLRWALLLMIANPLAAEKVQREIDDSIGRERSPRMSDRSALPYTQAVIEEVLRKSSLVPMGIFHRVTDDVQVGDYRLPKGSICNFNVYAIHHDHRLFAEPQEFRPERHLGADGQFVGCEQLSAFGLGKRACLGENLARMELFLFFTSIMQRYSFSLDIDETRSLWELTENPDNSLGTSIRAPPLHKLVFSRR